LILNSSEVEQCSAAHQLDKAIRCDTWHRDHDVAADNGDLSFSHTKSVDSLADDLLRLLNLHIGDGLTGRDWQRRQDDLRAAAEIKPELRSEGVTRPKGPCR
jgi:hypothetical protein